MDAGSPMAPAAGVGARSRVSSVWNNRGALGVTRQLVVRSSLGNQALTWTLGSGFSFQVRALQVQVSLV